MLRVVVQPVGPEGNIGVRHLQEGEDQGAEHGQRHRAGQDDEGVAEAVELGGQHQKDQDNRQGEGRQERVAFAAQLARFAGIVDDIALGQDLGGLVLQKSQGLVQGADRHAADLDGIELLEAVQRAGHGGSVQGGHGAERHQLTGRAGDIDILQLIRVEPVNPLDLGDNLVAAAGNVEAVDVIAAQHGTEIAPDLLQVEVRDRPPCPGRYQSRPGAGRS